MSPSTPESESRVLIAVLRLTSNSQTVSLDQVASKAKAPKTVVKHVLSTVLGTWNKEDLHVTPAFRFQLAMKAAETYGLTEAVKSLTWEEFEKFTEVCLFKAGFTAQRNVRVEGERRTWQIDVVGYKRPLLVGIDCKHWKPPNYLSKFSLPAIHQKQALAYLAANPTDASHQNAQYVALPVILTLHDPPQAVHQGSVLLSIEKLPDFLEKITPFSEGLPFITSDKANIENPIKRTP